MQGDDLAVGMYARHRLGMPIVLTSSFNMSFRFFRFSRSFGIQEYA
jgi:hypothetical protein